MAELAGDYVAPAAEAASNLTPMPLERSHLKVTYAEPKTIFKKSDSELLDPLGDGTVTKIKLNRGGTSLSLRLDFSNGTRAAFKPEQTFLQSDPRREIARDRVVDLVGWVFIGASHVIIMTVEHRCPTRRPSQAIAGGGRTYPTAGGGRTHPTAGGGRHIGR